MFPRLFHLFVCLLLIGPITAPGWTTVRPETRVGGSPAFSSTFASPSASQVAEPHQENPACVYDFASGVRIYLYAHSNPVNGVDPSGHEFSLVGLSIANGIGVGLQTMYDSTVVALGVSAMNTLSAVAFGLAIDDMLPSYHTSLTVGDEISYEFAVMGFGGQELITIKADLIALAKSGAKMISSIPRGGGGWVLVDSNEALNLQKDPTLGGRIKSGEKPLISYVSAPELRNVIARNERLGNDKGLKGLPKSFSQIDVLTSRPDASLSVHVRGQGTKTLGKIGDGIIGAQAIENEIPLVTNDGELARIVNRAKPGLARGGVRGR